MSSLIQYKMKKHNLNSHIAFTTFAVLSFIILAASYYPGLLISDAMTAYSGAVRNQIDDGYGIFWTATLIALSNLSGTPLLATLVQCALYLVLGNLLLRRVAGASVWVEWLTAILLLSPVFLMSAFYQHRDTAFALAFLWLILILIRKNSRFEVSAAAAATLCCLLRPDFSIAFVSGAIVAAYGAHQAGAPIALRPVLLWSAAPVLAILFRLVAPEIAPVAPRGDIQTATFTVQPVCAVVEDRPAYNALAAETRRAIEAAFSREALEEHCAIGNIWIFWSPENAFGQLGTEQRDAYFDAVGRAILENVPLVAGRALAIHMSANGMGYALEGFMDILRDPRRLEPQFAIDLIETAPRADWARGAVVPFENAVNRTGFALWRAMLMNSLLVLAAILVLHRFRRDTLLDAAVVMILVRSATLLAAPSAQYAYHFPVHLAGTAVLVWLLARRDARCTI